MKKTIKIILLFMSIILITIGSFLQYRDYKAYLAKQKKIKLEKERVNKINSIKSHYNKFVKTNKDTILYKYTDNKFNKIGLIGNNIELTLKDIDIDENTMYFCDLDDYCVKYEALDKIDKLTENVSKLQYKKYIKFNENIVTDDKTIFYDSNGFVYQIDEGMSLPIIIKDTDKYYVEYNNKLLYVKKDEIKEIKSSNNSNEPTRDSIRTLTYHFIYDPAKDKCYDDICLTTDKFEEQMKYLSDNNYFTLTMNDLELFMDKKIRIPKKSIVITLDDGQYYENAVNIVEKYKVYATFFIITAWFDVSKVETTYMDFQSHTDSMHVNWKCPGGNQGGLLLCAEKDDIIKDIKTSIQKLGENTFALSYPFFDFNDRAISILKEAGIRLAFIGQYDTDGVSYQTTNKMLLRRKTIFDDITIDLFKSYL